MSTPSVDEVVEVLDRRVERALRRERADVQLVDHRAGQRDAAPGLVGPAERLVVDDGAEAVRAVREPQRTRVGERLAAVERRTRSGCRGARRARAPSRPRRRSAPWRTSTRGRPGRAPGRRCARPAAPRRGTSRGLPHQQRHREVTEQLVALRADRPSSVTPDSTSVHRPVGELDPGSLTRCG